MDNNTVIRAWKDKNFRSQLRSEVPANPAGSSSLTANQVEQEPFMSTTPQPLCSLHNCCCN